MNFYPPNHNPKRMEKSNELSKVIAKSHWQNPKYERIATELVWLDNKPCQHSPEQKNTYLYNGNVIFMTNTHRIHHTLDKDYLELYINEN
jgi:hypothetical protein